MAIHRFMEGCDVASEKGVAQDDVSAVVDSTITALLGPEAAPTPPAATTPPTKSTPPEASESTFLLLAALAELKAIREGAAAKAVPTPTSTPPSPPPRSWVNKIVFCVPRLIAWLVPWCITTCLKFLLLFVITIVTLALLVAFYGFFTGKTLFVNNESTRYNYGGQYAGEI